MHEPAGIIGAGGQQRTTRAFLVSLAVAVLLHAAMLCRTGRVQHTLEVNTDTLRRLRLSLSVSEADFPDTKSVSATQTDRTEHGTETRKGAKSDRGVNRELPLRPGRHGRPGAEGKPNMVETARPTPGEMRKGQEAGTARTPRAPSQRATGRVPSVRRPETTDSLRAAGRTAPATPRTHQAEATGTKRAASLIVPVHQPAPAYPPRARRRRIQGYVEIEFSVDAAGAVRDLRIIEAKPRGVFESSVRSAVRKWRFQVPAGFVGERMHETIRFQLEP